MQVSPEGKSMEDQIAGEIQRLKTILKTSTCLPCLECTCAVGVHVWGQSHRLLPQIQSVVISLHGAWYWSCPIGRDLGQKQKSDALWFEMVAQWKEECPYMQCAAGGYDAGNAMQVDPAGSFFPDLWALCISSDVFLWCRFWQCWCLLPIVARRNKMRSWLQLPPA